MTVIINGTTGIDKVVDGSIGTIDLADGAVTQAKLSANLAGNGPAFSAYLATTQSGVVSTTWTLVNINGEVFDPANAFDTTTYKFTPAAAGYYQFNASLNIDAASGLTIIGLALNKNSISANGMCGLSLVAPQTATSGSVSTSGMFYLNGTTDYVVVLGYAAGTTLSFTGGGNGAGICYFSGFLARAV